MAAGDLIDRNLHLLEDTTHVVLSARLDISSLGVVLKNLLILLDILVLDVIVDTVKDTLFIRKRASVLLQILCNFIQ